MNMRNERLGFTLIELLIVISIIGILAAIVYASFDSAREISKNRAMQAEMKEVQLAMEVYKAQYGQYPPALSVGGVCSGSAAGLNYAYSRSCGTIPIINGLVPDFLANLFSHNESGNSACNLIYRVDDADGTWDPGDGTFYKLTAANCHAGVEVIAGVVEGGVDHESEFARCPSTCAAVGVCDPASVDFYESYAIYSAGGECI